MPALLLNIRPYRIRRSFTNLASIHVHTAHASLRRERDKGRAQLCDIAFTLLLTYFRQHDNAASFRRFIGK